MLNIVAPYHTKMSNICKSVYVFDFGTFSEYVVLQLIHIYISSTCKGFMLLISA